MLDDKIKEYEYLQFLWGIRHRAPHKISPLDVRFMLVFRTIIIVLLGLLGLAAHILGRCEPTCLILAYLLLRNRDYVMLRS